MFRLTEIKVAGAIAAGAVALGAAGAYAANTLPVGVNKTPAGTVNGQTIWAVQGNTTTLKTSFTSYGECVSWFASHKGFVFGGTSTTAPTSVKKNYHGKLMSQASTLCTKTKDSTSTDNETQASTSSDNETADAAETDTGTPPAWAHHGGRH
jgi:hypothetical protein